MAAGGGGGAEGGADPGGGGGTGYPYASTSVPGGSGYPYVSTSNPCCGCCCCECGYPCGNAADVAAASPNVVGAGGGGAYTGSGAPYHRAYTRPLSDLN